MGFGKLVKVALKDIFIKFLERYTFKRNDEVCRDDELLYLGSLFSPVRLFEWQVTVTDKPSEENSAALDATIFDNLPCSRTISFPASPVPESWSAQISARE
jgi:hypothetical protein